MDPARQQEIARCLFRESNDAFLIFDPEDHRVVDLNPAALRLTGFDRKAALTMRVGDLISSEDPEGLARLIDAYQKTGFFHSREDYYLRRQEGDPIAVNISMSRIHTTPAPLGLAVIRDISERRKAQEFLERFFRHSPALFAIVSPEGYFLKTNPAWQHVLGLSAEELQTRPAREFLSPEHPAGEGDGPPGEAGEAAGPEVRCRGKDGGDRWISWSFATVDGLTFAVGLDVTAAKQASELRRAKEAAEGANRAKGLFLARMSHELRTPLTAILGLVEVLRNDPSARQISPERAEDLRTIKLNGEHLLRLINDVLDLSRIEEGRLDLDLSPCDPARIAAEVADLMRVRAAAKGLSLAVEVASAIPARVETDPVRLRQILLNLVGNAIAFTEAGGVRLRVGLAGGPAEPAWLRFEVNDTGVGVTPEEIAGLFEPFRRASLTPKRRPGGAGLGLAISRQLAEALGGRIDVCSEPGVGSTFSLLLPAVEPRVREPAPATPEESGPPPRAERPPARRILLAEDNEDNRRAVQLRLQQLGHEVVTAKNGEEALDLALPSLAAGHPFDLILMDMQMPVLDGLEATMRLRAAGYSAPIVALTAFALDDDREESLRAGCDDHISKPIDWDRLVALIGRLPPPATGGPRPG